MEASYSVWWSGASSEVWCWVDSLFPELCCQESSGWFPVLGWSVLFPALDWSESFQESGSSGLFQVLDWSEPPYLG